MSVDYLLSFDGFDTPDPPKHNDGDKVEKKEDPVNHPTHYTAHPSGVECIEITEHMPFNIGNAIKYLWRAGLKGGQPTLQDYDKAIWYIQREKKRLKLLEELDG